MSYHSDMAIDEAEFAEPHPMDPENLKQITIYTDGSIEKNPGGVGAYAAILMFEDHPITHVREVGQSMFNGPIENTNNRMELLAAIYGLEAVKGPSKVTLISDSQYVIRGMTDYVPKWQKRGDLNNRQNADLWKKLLKVSQQHLMDWRWVRGHNGDEYNEMVDKVAGQLMRSCVDKNTLQTHDRRYKI